MKRLRRLVLASALTLPWALVRSQESQAQQRFSIADVASLTGCWAGRTGELQLREQWTDAAGGLMLGTTRFLRDGSVVDWEFGRLLSDGEGVVLWPYPGGALSEHGFRLVRVSPALVFENLEHDFPVRISYAPSGSDALRVRIEDANGNGREWSVSRVPCPDGL